MTSYDYGVSSLTEKFWDLLALPLACLFGEVNDTKYDPFFRTSPETLLKKNRLVKKPARVLVQSAASI